MFRRFRAWLAFLLAATMLVLAAVPAAAAPVPGPLTEAQALTLLTHYDLVRGDPNGDLRLYDRITRAEAAAIFVRAVGLEDEAQQQVRISPFTDTQGHWAAPVIAMAAQQELVKGDGNGLFRPDDSITYAEVLTVLLRIVQQEPSGPWQPTVIHQAAARLGFAPPGIDPHQPALRGRIFYALANAAACVTLPGGLTPLQTYVDGEPPVISLDQTQISTTASRVEIKGHVDDAAWVEVNGRRATLNQSSGAFAYEVAVEPGTSRFTVEAADLANNRSTATVTVERLHPASRLVIEGPAVIQANKSVKLTVTAYDENGRQIGLEGLEYDLTGGVATFNPNTLTLTAGSKTGEGTLTLRVSSARATYKFTVGAPSKDADALEIQEVNKGKTLSPDKSYTVKVRVVDDRGRLVDEDSGREVTLSASGLSGITIEPKTALTQDGVATFSIKSSKQGSFTLKASSRSLDGDEVDLEVYEFPIIVLEAAPETVTAGSDAVVRITAELQDEDGDPVKNRSNRDIEIQLRGAGSYGKLLDDVLVIKKGSTSSEDYAEFQVGSKTGTATISGRIESRHDYFIKPVSIAIKKGDQVSPSSLRFVISGPTGVQQAGEPVDLILKVVDEKGSTVTKGNYAFQLGLAPTEGAVLTLAGTDVSPLSGTNVVARTVNGEARLQLTYSGSGTVAVTPVGAGDNYIAHDGITHGWAESSLNFRPGDGIRVAFISPIASIDAVVDSGLGADLSNGAMGSGGDAQSTITVSALDQNKQLLSSARGSVTLTKVSGQATRVVGGSTQPLTGSKASFQIVPSGTGAGVDTYQVSLGSLTDTVTIAVRNERLTPVIEAVNTTGGFEVVLGPVAESPYWAHVQIQWDEVLAFDQVVDLAAQRNLRLNDLVTLDGKHTVQVKVNNGAGWSTPVTTEARVGLVPIYGIDSAWYDAVSQQLTLKTTLPAGQLHPEKLTLEQAGAAPVSLAGTEVISQQENLRFILKVNAKAEQLQQLAGAVNLRADEGWYAAAEGEPAVPADLQTPVKPMARIQSAYVDFRTGSLILKGAGLDQGQLVWERIHVRLGEYEPFALKGEFVTAQTADSVTLDLSKAPHIWGYRPPQPKLSLVLDDGWLAASDGTAQYRAAGYKIPLELQTD